jgi:hypothetical protein
VSPGPANATARLRRLRTDEIPAHGFARQWQGSPSGLCSPAQWPRSGYRGDRHCARGRRPRWVFLWLGFPVSWGPCWRSNTDPIFQLNDVSSWRLAIADGLCLLRCYEWPIASLRPAHHGVRLVSLVTHFTRVLSRRPAEGFFFAAAAISPFQRFASRSASCRVCRCSIGTNLPAPVSAPTL